MFSYLPESPAIPLDRLLAVRDWMTHRGPDAFGLWKSKDGCLALAHRRLSIIDLSDRATQPMISENGRYVVSFNGEIYNHLELRSRLACHGYRLRTNSDTEVLLYLYDLYGAGMFEHLRGMYAFAIWDTQERELILARDPLGIKPLYVADNGKTLWFASQVRPLIALAGLEKTEDPAGHVGYFLWGHVPEPYTLFRSVRALPAGHTLRIRYGGTQAIKEHWSTAAVVSERADTTHHESRDVTARRSLRALLSESVKHHLVADVPIGIFLSAGRDSTTLLGLASELTNTSIHTLTIGFSEFAGTANDETSLARVAAAHYGANHHEFWYSSAEMQESIQPFLSAMDQPTVDGFNNFLVSRAASQQGLKVAISGVGADELFGGYSTFREIPRLVRKVRPLAFMPGLASTFRFCAAPLVRSFANPKYSSIIEFGGTIGGAYLLRRGMFLPWELKSISGRRTTPDWNAATAAVNRLRNDRRSGYRCEDGDYSIGIKFLLEKSTASRYRLGVYGELS